MRYEYVSGYTGSVLWIKISPVIEHLCQRMIWLHYLCGTDGSMVQVRGKSSAMESLSMLLSDQIDIIKVFSFQ